MISWLVLGVSGQPKVCYLTRVGQQFIKALNHVNPGTFLGAVT